MFTKPVPAPDVSRTKHKQITGVPLAERDTTSVTSLVRDHEVTYPTTYIETLIHFFKANLGGGLFAMGEAIKNSGILVGPIVILILGFIATECMHMLANASDRMAEKTGLRIGSNYPAVVGLCFEYGKPSLYKWRMFMYNLTEYFLLITQFGFCCVYIVFVSHNWKQLLESCGVFMGMRLVMCLVVVVPAVTCLIRKLKYLAPISGISMVLLITGLLIIGYFIFQKLDNPLDSKFVAESMQYPLFFGTILFSFECIGMVLPLKNEMRNPELFQKLFGVLNVGMFCATLLYSAFGVLIYLRYGEETKPSVTLNLPQDTYLGLGTKLIISVALLLSYPLQFYVLAELIWNHILLKQQNMKHRLLKEQLFRLGLVLMTFILAQCIPFLNLLIALVGSLTGTTLVMILPPILELVSIKITPFIIIKNCIILTLGIIGTIAGTFTSTQEIIIEIMKSGWGFS